MHVGRRWWCRSAPLILETVVPVRFNQDVLVYLFFRCSVLQVLDITMPLTSFWTPLVLYSEIIIPYYILIRSFLVLQSNSSPVDNLFLESPSFGFLISLSKQGRFISFMVHFQEEIFSHYGWKTGLRQVTDCHDEEQKNIGIDTEWWIRNAQ